MVTSADNCRAPRPGRSPESPHCGDDGDIRLRRTVERLLTTAESRQIRVHSLARRPSPFATLFPAEVVTLTFQDGGDVSLFVKQLGPEQADHPDKQCRDREVRVYEELLAGSDVSAPRYYGSARNEASGRLEVFLGYVDDLSLKYQPIAHWLTAARRLARLHAHFAARVAELSVCEFLLRLDAEYLHAWADRAVETVRDLYPDAAAGLERVGRDYGRVSALLGRQPPTLVHNDLSPKNVLADRSKSPAAIHFVDWETAGVGCGVMDLAHLKYGLGPEDDQAMCAAYQSELESTGLHLIELAEWDAVLAACELHKTVYRLASCRAWGLPAARIAGWVAEAQEFLSRVRGGHR